MGILSTAEGAFLQLNFLCDPTPPPGARRQVGGAAVCATKELHEAVRFWQNVQGNIMAPQAAFYQLQTAKTMRVRLLQQSDSALKIATFLEAHPKVEWVVPLWLL